MGQLVYSGKGRMGTHQGMFVPTYPNKYRGEVHNIKWRSSWEAQVMQYLDMCEDCPLWSSEELKIPYVMVVNGREKNHTYLPDFLYKLKGKTYLAEVKPHKETIKPVRPNKKRITQKALDRYEKEVWTYIKNMSKWNAAIKLCEKRGWKFQLITEKNLAAFTL